MAVAAAKAPNASIEARSSAPVRAWLVVLALLVVAMTAVGGATRLTGSGLSITEWRPVTGAIPPLDAAQWLAEFERYRAIPQYELVNKGMTLTEFKRIYAWEWGHRQLGRLIGLAFLIPLVVFWIRGLISRQMALRLLGIGALGGLQGAVGWIMVASGLEPGMTAVAPVKLMLHLTLASVILASLVWAAAGLRDVPSPLRGGAEGVGGGAGRGEPVSSAPELSRRDGVAVPSVQPPTPAPPREGEGGAPILLLFLVVLQIALGALVAGSKAGLTYNTWPLMDGMLVPPLAQLFVVDPWIENFVDNVTLVQFNHRLVGTVLVAFALWHAIRLSRYRPRSPAARRAQGLAALCLAQMVLGIVTLLLAVPIWAGLAHQVFAMAVLALAVVHARRSLPERSDSASASISASLSPALANRA